MGVGRNMVKKRVLCLFLVFGVFSVSCKTSSQKNGDLLRLPSAADPPATPQKVEGDPTTPEILKRPQVTNIAYVKQILVTFEQLNPRFSIPKRTYSEAVSKVHEILNEYHKGTPFEELMKKYSDDPQTGPFGESQFMEADGVPGSTRHLAVRLNVGEIGVTQSGNSFHILLRVADLPPVTSPDSQDILARAPNTQSAAFKSVNIAWRELKQVYMTQISQGALNRNQTQAAQLAKDILAKIRAGESVDKFVFEVGEVIPLPETAHVHSFAEIIRPHDHQHNDHDHTKDDHSSMETAKLVREIPEIATLAVRLKPGESGIVTSRFGYHVVYRVR